MIPSMVPVEVMVLAEVLSDAYFFPQTILSQNKELILALEQEGLAGVTVSHAVSTHNRNKMTF